MLIAAERGGISLEQQIGDEDDVAIAAITAAELLVGELLATGRRRAARRTFIETLLATVPVERYDLAVARVHAELLAHTRKAGRPRGAHDLVIAATARARARTVVTADVTGFDDLPDVLVRRLATST